MGTIATGIAAFRFGSALAVGLTYALVEVAFDVVLIALVRRSPAFKFEHPTSAPALTVRWRDLLRESWGVLVIGVTPQVTILVDAAVVGHVDGPAAVAIYAVCQRVGYLLPRVFVPFTDSLFVSLIRANGADRRAIAKHAAALSWVLVISGLALSCAIVTLGDGALTLVFGPGYGRGESALAVLAVAATVRAMYVPSVKRLQADAALGTLPGWFLASGVAHIALAIVLTIQWSLLGTAVSVLLAALAFEAWPVDCALRHRDPSVDAPSSGAFTPTIAAFIGGALVVLITWYRVTTGGWAPLISGAAALVLGSLALRQLILYLKSSRSVIVRD